MLDAMAIEHRLAYADFENAEYAGLQVRYAPVWDNVRVIKLLPDSDELWERIKLNPDEAFIVLQDAGMIADDPQKRVALTCFRRRFAKEGGQLHVEFWQEHFRISVKGE